MVFFDSRRDLRHHAGNGHYQPIIAVFTLGAARQNNTCFTQPAGLLWGLSGKRM